MPWHCPACQTIITHNELDPVPKVGHRYRCHVCRLELQVHVETERLVVAPLDGDHHVEVKDQRARRLPAPMTYRDKPTRRK